MFLHRRRDPDDDDDGETHYTRESNLRKLFAQLPTLREGAERECVSVVSTAKGRLSNAQQLEYADFCNQ